MDYELLIIDDDEVFLHMHEQLLLRYGMTKSPFKFETCEKALDYMVSKMSENKRFFVLLDIYMDGMNGWDFMDKLLEKKLVDQTQVAVVTSSINLHDHKKRNQYSNICAFIEKPFTKQHIHQLMDETELKEFL